MWDNRWPRRSPAATPAALARWTPANMNNSTLIQRMTGSPETPLLPAPDPEGSDRASAPSHATATAGAQCEASAGAAISEENPMQGRRRRRATSAATASPTPAAITGASTATSLRDRRSKAASAIARIWASANQAASPSHSEAARLLRLAPDHSRQARPRSLHGLLAAVGGRHLVRAIGQAVRECDERRRSGEVFVHQSGPGAAKRRSARPSAMTKLRVIPV